MRDDAPISIGDGGEKVRRCDCDERMSRRTSKDKLLESQKYSSLQAHPWGERALTLQKAEPLY